MELQAISFGALTRLRVSCDRFGGLDRLHAMAVFVEVAERGSFVAAARALRLGAPAVTRTISALEAHLGVRLFVRTTRAVKPTDAALRFLADARRILGEIDEAEASAAGSGAEPRGRVRLTASVLFGRHYVVPIVLEYLERHPLVSVETVFLDRIIDLVGEGIDVAVRIGDLPDSSLTAVRVGTIRPVLVASPGYLAARGVPATPKDLARHVLIQANAESATWDLAAGVSVRVAARFVAGNPGAALEAALQGYGITRVLSYQAAPFVHEGKLAVFLSDDAPRVPVHVVHAHGPRPAARIQRIVELLRDRLRGARLEAL